MPRPTYTILCNGAELFTISSRALAETITRRCRQRAAPDVTYTLVEDWDGQRVELAVPEPMIPAA